MKKILMMFLLVLMSVSLIACTPEDSKGEDITEDNPIVEKEDEEGSGSSEEIVDPSPKTDSQEVVLYFSNKKYVETGDESLDRLLTETRLVEYGDISLEEAIVKELIKGAESEELATSIPSTAKLLGVETSNNIAFVNFSRDGLFGGSLQEGFTISQIVNSLLELDSVDQVQFLVDGEKTESLMGHFDAMEPFTSQQDQ